jgi:CubicO group peptidase (beta-lactamase class C family)
MTILEHANPEDAGFLPERIELLDERLNEWTARGLSPATSVLVARHGKIVYQKAFGKLTPDGRRLNVDDIFFLASIQKVFTATAVMMCVERGIVDLNVPITDYLPEVPAEWGNAILVHNLLTHTSGYFEPDFETLGRVMSGEDKTDPCPAGQNENIHRYLSVAFRTKPIKKPSIQNIYSGINYQFLGEILRRTTGKFIDEYMEENILVPLGMTSSFHPWGKAPEDRLVHHPTPFGDEARRQMMKTTPSGIVGLVSNTMDLAVFCQAFLNGGSYGDVKLLAPSTVREMTRNQIRGIGARTLDGIDIKEATWGLGWMVQGDARWRYGHGSLQPVGTYYHQGGSGTAIWVDPHHEIVSIFLSVARDFTGYEFRWDFDLFQNLVMSALDD